MSLGLEIAQARRRKAMTQRQLADLCGCTIGSISDYERGRAFPREARIQLELAGILGIEPGALLERIGQERMAKPTAGNGR